MKAKETGKAGGLEGLVVKCNGTIKDTKTNQNLVYNLVAKLVGRELDLNYSISGPGLYDKDGKMDPGMMQHYTEMLTKYVLGLDDYLAKNSGYGPKNAPIEAKYSEVPKAAGYQNQGTQRIPYQKPGYEQPKKY